MKSKKTYFVALGAAILPILAHATGVCMTHPSNIAEATDTVVTLQEITVRTHLADERNTPLNLTTITPQKIRLHSTSPTYVAMLQGIPGVYATASTGSYGDASLNMRGFKQDNIAILLNGIPIQGLTSGSMYWSNWMGLADATHTVQVQKGLGTSMLADCAMGGSVNIVTRTATALPHINMEFNISEWGTAKGNFAYSTGNLGKGWSANMSLSYVKGSGYVQCTDVETLSYLLSVAKTIGNEHTITFTALGSPEEHDQRNTELSNAEVQQYGRDYSKNWGYYNGKPYSIARNHYYKPYFTLQHTMKAERVSMNNSVYLAIADGGGRSTYAAPGATSIINHQTTDGHIDFDAIVAENQESGASQNMMIDFLSGHTQAGAIASGDYRLSEALTASAGMQYQYYSTWQKMKVLDLLGGDYWWDGSTQQRLTVGDYVGSRYGRTTHHASAFAQMRYANSRINANLGISVFNGNYRRSNHITGEHSQWAHGWGMSIKGGVLWHLNGNNALYVNGGYNSRLPYAGVYLASSDLSITNDITNEKNLMAEAGWRAKWQGGALELSGYVASWRNKTLTVNIAKRADEAAEKYQVKGLNALHLGAELNAHQQLTPWLRLSAYAMMASWKWRNSGRAIIYDSYNGDTLNEFTIQCDGLHVGDAPQTQLGAEAQLTLPAGFYLNASWQMNARMYADFEPSSRTADNHADAYRLPSYHLLNATIGWRGYLTNDVSINVFATGNNLTDAHYFERGIDGANHDLDTFRGFTGRARTMSIGLRLQY
ncbi:MAG: TonB-dependent receptor [Muribaculaceae bacterium]